MSFKGDRHSNLRHCSGFEPPPAKSISRAFIENLISCAFHHHRVGNFAGRGINRHNANAAGSDVGALCFVGVIGTRGANGHSFCS